MTRTFSPVARAPLAMLTGIVTVVAMTSIAPAHAQAAPVTVTTWQELTSAAEARQSPIVLGHDIVAPANQNLVLRGEVTLDLATHQLDIGTPPLGEAALMVSEYSDLTITGTSGTLSVLGIYGAGIGGSGGTFESPGNITIAGGRIEADSVYGAAIGAGHRGYASTVSISGGTVIAGSIDGAGVGGGLEGHQVGRVTITGGTTLAFSINGAGIGSGRADANMAPRDGGGTIDIAGGDVTAHSNLGAGIGGGYNAGPGGTVTISGGKTTAFSDRSAGIGTSFTAGTHDSPGTLTVLGTPTAMPMTVTDGGGPHSARITVESVEPPRYFQTDRLRTPVGGSIIVSYSAPTVTFNANYRSGPAPQPVTVSHNGTVRPPDLSRDGHILAGWSTTADPDTATFWDFNTPITDDLTLYAHWTPAPSTAGSLGSLTTQSTAAETSTSGSAS